MEGHLAWGYFGPDGVTLFTAKADGSGTKRLLPEGTFSEQPHWSPDGKKLAVAADGGIGAVVNADGTGYRAFNHPKGATNLACVLWSPDGTRLACEGFDVPGHDGVYTVRATDGLDLRRVTKKRDVPCSFSPDGSKMLISRLNPADEIHNRLMIVNADGTNARLLIDRVGCGDWSPDGKSVLTVADGSIMRVDLEGKATKIPVDGVVTSGTFSPDGSSIVLSVHPGDHNTDLYTMRVDGSHLHQITKTPEDEEFGDWGP